MDCKAIKTDQACFLRVRVEVPLDRPLWRGGLIVSLEGDAAKVVFRYEHLVGWCFACGRIGHEIKECTLSNKEDKNDKPYGEWLKAGTRLRSEMPRNLQRSPERCQKEPTAQTEPTPHLANPSVTCCTDQESAKILETAIPDSICTLQQLMHLKPTPLSSPLTFPVDSIFPKSNSTSNQNQTNMETDIYEGDLYCVPVNYGKTTARVTPLAANTRIPIGVLQVKHKAT